MRRAARPDSNRSRGTVLERRFMLSMAVVILALMGPAVVVVQYRAAENLQTSERVRATSMARSIGAVSTPALLSYNYVGLGEAARTAADEEGIAYIIIHDKEGLVAGDSRTYDAEGLESTDPVSIAAVKTTGVLVQQVSITDSRNQQYEAFDVAVPVFVEGSSEKWGTVRVGVSLQAAQAAVTRITASLLALSAIGFFLCLLGARAASRKITRPLQMLREGTLALAGGDLSHRLCIKTGDEIEDLASHFNHMADEVEARQAEAREAGNALEALNASLEAEVRLRTEAQVQSEKKYRTVVEGSPMGIAILRGGQTIYGNPAYRDMAGEEQPHPLEILHDDEKEMLTQYFDSWNRSETIGPMEVRINAPDGQVRHVEMRWMAFSLDDLPADLCMLTDVTTVRKLKEQVAVSDKLRALGELASGVAHDFNNCLAIILGRSQLMDRKTDDEIIKKGLAVIQKAASDGGQTVRRIQEFARVRKDSRHSTYEMSHLIDDIIEITQSKWKNEAESRGAKISVETQYEHTAPVTGNAAELREALTNLVINAVDAMPRGGTITFKTGDEVIDGVPFVSIAVSDTGNGIPEDALRLVFDPFFSTKGNLGTGLGLSITYGIITRHGGTIRVESDMGRGTTFTIRIPVGEASASSPSGETEDMPFLRCRLLVVDDEPEILEVLDEALKAAGYDVTTAPGGREAISLINENDFGLVLTDLGMPEVTGWDVVEAARKRNPSILLGLVTGWGETLDGARLRDRGIEIIISKPFEMNHLLKEVRGAIARHHLDAA